MSYVQLRRLSIASIKDVLRRLIPARATEYQQPLTSLPHVTGAGAFIEPVSYQILGSSHNLLNVKLPKSSIMNIRYSNKQQKIVALNGKISSLYTELTKLDSNIVFQRCFNQTEPMSLLIAQNSENSNFAMIELKKNYWMVQRNSLFAWSGSSIKPYATKHSKIVQMKGEGTFILSSPGQVTQLILEQDESIQINANVILGFTSEKEDFSDIVDGLENTSKSLVNLSVGKIGLFNKVASFTQYLRLPNSLITDPTVKKVVTLFTKFATPIKKAISYSKGSLPKLKQKDSFIELKGPKTILISNSVQFHDKALSNEQIRLLTN